MPTDYLLELDGIRGAATEAKVTLPDLLVTSYQLSGHGGETRAAGGHAEQMDILSWSMPTTQAGGFDLITDFQASWPAIGAASGDGGLRVAADGLTGDVWG